MSKFNLKKQAVVAPYEKMLADNNDEHGLSEIDNPGTIEYHLGKKVRKDNDNTVPMDRQLLDVRTKNTSDLRITEGALNEDPKLFADRRRDKEYTAGVPTIQLLNEAFDQKKLALLKKQENKESRDTSFWDDFVGVEMEGKTTKVLKNVPKTQLENAPDRFKSLDKTQPITGDYAKNEKANDKNNKIPDITASLKDADGMLFHIFATAASEKRETNAQENQMIKDINAGKTKLLAQWGEDIDDFDNDREFEDNEARDNMRNELDYGDPDEPKSYTTIEPSKEGDGFHVYEYGTYEPTSILAGKERKTFVDSFHTVEEAQAKYPDASVGEGYREPIVQVPQEPEPLSENGY